VIRDLHGDVVRATILIITLMKSSLFVAISSIALLAWLAASYVTQLKPEPRLGRGSLPLSAQQKATETQEPRRVLIAEQQD
jgi:hypothetical protein